MVPVVLTVSGMQSPCQSISQAPVSSGALSCVALNQRNKMKLQKHMPTTDSDMLAHLADLLKCDVASAYESEPEVYLVYPESYEVPVSVVKVYPGWANEPWKSQVLTVSKGVHNPIFSDCPTVQRARRVALDHIALATA